MTRPPPDSAIPSEAATTSPPASAATLPVGATPPDSRKADPSSSAFHLVVGVHTFTAMLPMVQRGDEQFVEHEVGKLLEHAIALRLSQLGETSAVAFRFMRKSMGMRVSNLGDLVGVSAGMVKAWESGEQPIPRSCWDVLAALVVKTTAGRAELVEIR